MPAKSSAVPTETRGLWCSPQEAASRKSTQASSSLHTQRLRQAVGGDRTTRCPFPLADAEDASSAPAVLTFEVRRDGLPRVVQACVGAHGTGGEVQHVASSRLGGVLREGRQADVTCCQSHCLGATSRDGRPRAAHKCQERPAPSADDSNKKDWLAPLRGIHAARHVTVVAEQPRIQTSYKRLN